YTYIPAPGYGFQPAAGIVADFQFTVDVNGHVGVDPMYSGFAQSDGGSLTLRGYAVALDLQELSSPVAIALLDHEGVLRPGVDSLTMVPASGYTLIRPDGPAFGFSVGLNGETTLVNAPLGITADSSRRMCAVPDEVVTDLQIRTYGPPHGKWSRTALSFSVKPENAGGLHPDQVETAIEGALSAWEVASQIFTFKRVDSNGDLHFAFGAAELNSKFGVAEGVVGSGHFPESGEVDFFSRAPWSSEKLTADAIHEIGHALGLTHSNNPDSVMYPSETGLLHVDAESQLSLHNLYGWVPQPALSDRGTSDRPALAVAGQVGLTFSDQTMHMAWRGVDGDDSLYESTLEGTVWSPQRPITGPFGSAYSPALTSVAAGTPPSTGLMMAWRGVPGDDSIYYSTKDGSDWATPSNIPDIGSNDRPALANFEVPHMAWQGISGDDTIYWSRFVSGAWESQRHVGEVGTFSGPALAVLGSRLYMFWRGVHDDTRIYYSSLGAGATEWEPQKIASFVMSDAGGGGGISQVPVEIHAADGPAATTHGNGILLAWRVPDGQSIAFTLFDGEVFAGRTQVDGQSCHGPAICSFLGTVFLVFRGPTGDDSMHWAKLGALPRADGAGLSG
ncbi:matrixin family metalloprotease, partial [Kitasatospora sp. NPDC059747]|uniref:matrixin family metalloprotease n=1 Tax=Kitasatospora sp. NPDC059747 TaxID=3346930 RepID=UPI003653ADC4